MDELSSAQLESFKENGFLYLRRISSHEEVQEIRTILSDLFARGVGVKEGAQFDVLNPGSDETMTLGQMTNPCDYAPALKKTEYVRRAHKLAKEILGPRALRSADFVLMKPARTGAATPWHQDQAYRSGDSEFEELSFWMPLQDVDEQSGCMQFVPGTQRGPIKIHRSPNNDLKSHSLESCETPTAEEIVSVPMQAGDCSIHDGRVLHGTPPNRSEVSRFAYILVFQNPPSPVAEPKTYPWLLEKQNSHKERREAWFWSGGIFVVAWRKFRRGDFSSIDGIKLALRRGMRHVAKKRREQAKSRLSRSTNKP
jgi:hypothetical protein